MFHLVGFDTRTHARCGDVDVMCRDSSCSVPAAVKVAAKAAICEPSSSHPTSCGTAQRAHLRRWILPGIALEVTGQSTDSFGIDVVRSPRRRCNRSQAY
jgi:hypothetical protein